MKRRRPNWSARSLDALRAQYNPLENAVLDEFLSGRLSRRELLRHAAVLGFAAPLIAALPAAASTPGDGSASDASARPVTVGMTVPAGSIDPDHIHTPGIFVQRIVHLPADYQKRIEKVTTRPRVAA